MFGPNITGNINNSYVHYEFGTSGAFSSDRGTDRVTDGGAYGKTVSMSFRASWSDSTYGSSSYVQPNSLRLVHCIKF